MATQPDLQIIRGSSKPIDRILVPAVKLEYLDSTLFVLWQQHEDVFHCPDCPQLMDVAGMIERVGVRSLILFYTSGVLEMAKSRVVEYIDRS